MGYKAIANRINERGIKTKTGRLFSIFGIKTILTNPAYIGQIRCLSNQNSNTSRKNGEDKNPIIVAGRHEAIIDIELWEKVQAVQLVNKNSVSTNKNFNGDFLLSGILRCPKCGAGTVMTKRRKYDGSGYHLYYMCQAYHSKGKIACSTNLIRKERVEEQVISTIKSLLHSESIIEDVLKEIEHSIKRDTIEIEQTLQLLKTELAKIESRQKRLITITTTMPLLLSYIIDLVRN